jgi:3-hydroxyisobutyrate dehydrogenase-like beta-hydroxyacid dehydrogenase
MKLAVKDLTLLHDLARGLGAPIAQSDANLESYRRAVGAGFGDRDMAALADYLRRELDG